MRWLVVRWLQWEAIMFVWMLWREREGIRDALDDLWFGAWAHCEFPELYELLEEGQRRFAEGPDEALDDWYVVRSGFPPERLVELCDDPMLGKFARYVIVQQGTNGQNT